MRHVRLAAVLPLSVTLRCGNFGHGQYCAAALIQGALESQQLHQSSVLL
jgi:hypothetical protein